MTRVACNCYFKTSEYVNDSRRQRNNYFGLRDAGSMLGEKEMHREGRGSEKL